MRGRRVLPGLLLTMATPLFAGVTHYSLDATLRDGGLDAVVVVHVANTASEPLESIALAADSRSVEISSVSVDSTHDERELRLHFDPPIEMDGKREVRVRYRAQPSNGLVFEERAVYTAYHTWKWMPCDPSPGSRATFDVELTAPEGWTAAVPGERSVDEAEAGSRRWRGQLRRPYPAYLLGFAAGDWREREHRVDDWTVRVLAPRRFTDGQLDRALSHLERARRWFETVSGVPYPGSAYTQVFVTRAAQELVDLSVVSASHLDDFLRDPREDWLMVHELAHQWWGNGLTCRDWSHFWLNEGLTTFMVAAFKELAWGSEAYEREMALARRRYDWVREAGLEQSMVSAEWPDLRASRAVNYSKGALVLHMLRAELGEGPFWRAISQYTSQRFGEAVVTGDLQSAFREVARDPAPLDRLFDRWVYGSGVPQLRAEHRVGPDVVRVTLEQATGWLVETDVAWVDGAGRSVRPVLVDSRESEARVVLELPLSGELLSLRFDTSGRLPFAVDHDRSVGMLARQAATEPDVIGRMEAFDRLRRNCEVPTEACQTVDLDDLERQLVRYPRLDRD